MFNFSSYRSSCHALSVALDVDEMICIEMVTFMVSIGDLPRSSGRDLAKPEMSGFCSLAFAILARAAGMSKKSSVAVFKGCDPQDLFKPAEFTGCARIEKKVGRCAVTLSVPHEFYRVMHRGLTSFSLPKDEPWEAKT